MANTSFFGFEEVNETSGMVVQRFVEVFLEVLTGDSVELSKHLKKQKKKKLFS